MQSLLSPWGCRRHQCAAQRQRANGAELCVTKPCSRTNHPSNCSKKEKPNRCGTGTVIISDLLRQYQFRLGRIALRKCTGQEDGSVLPGCSRADEPGRPRPARSSCSTRSRVKSSSLFTGCLLISRMMSPRARFTSSANDPGFTSCTMTPLPAGMSSRSAISGVTLRTVTPNLLCLGAFSSSLP